MEKRILIIEGGVGKQKKFADILGCDQGYRVVGSATDEESALNLIPQLKPDIIVLDNSSMPINVLGKNTLDNKLANIFITIGIPASIKGYYFLREAVRLVIEDISYIDSITKLLYPKVAMRFDTSPCRVERGIRHAIEVAWNKGRIKNINSILGLSVYCGNEKPTNGELIGLLADKILLETY